MKAQLHLSVKGVCEGKSQEVVVHSGIEIAHQKYATKTDKERPYRKGWCQERNFKADEALLNEDDSKTRASNRKV